MNADERRFITTGNTDDADLTDFRGYEIRVYPRQPLRQLTSPTRMAAAICGDPRSIKGADIYHS